MPGPVAELLAILDLERLETDLFRGQCQTIGWPRVFGGQVVAQALVAAARTVPQEQPKGRPPHSLHAYFLLGGDPKAPIVYEVERIRDGGSFTTRRVKAVQHGRAIFAMSCSFHGEEPGYDHAAAMPDVPPPEALGDVRALAAKGGVIVPSGNLAYFTQVWPIELRPVETERYRSREPGPPHFHIWMRATERLPDDPAIHRAVLAFASDMSLLDSTLIAHGTTVFDPAIQTASLDHALWLHRPFRADEWLLYAQTSPSAGGARGFAHGSIFSRDGRLVASVAQEGLIRPRTR